MFKRKAQEHHAYLTFWDTSYVASWTKELGVHTNEQFQVAFHTVVQRQKTLYKSLFVSSKEIFQKWLLYSSPTAI